MARLAEPQPVAVDIRLARLDVRLRGGRSKPSDAALKGVHRRAGKLVCCAILEFLKPLGSEKRPFNVVRFGP